MFMHLTSLIRSVLSSPDADQHDRVWHPNTQLQNLMDIREIPRL